MGIAPGRSPAICAGPVRSIVVALATSLALMTTILMPLASPIEPSEPVLVTPTGVSSFPTDVLGYTPAQIRHAYGVDRIGFDGRGETVAIVTAYDYPTAASDVRAFSRRFNLPTMYGEDGPGCTTRDGPHPCFQRVANRVASVYVEDWATDAALAIEWAHAIAPAADILFVQAPKSTYADLLDAVDLAVTLGADVVTMSWSSPEFAGENAFDRHFVHAGTTFVSATGDLPGQVTYPAASPNVIAVGGTTLDLTPDGTIRSERPWPQSGWGPSTYEAAPPDQASLSCPGMAGRRVIPDVTYSADPWRGFPVLDSASRYGRDGWLRLGGTSAGAPQWAALIALGRPAAARPGINAPEVGPTLYNLARTDPVFRRVAGADDPTCSHSTPPMAFTIEVGLGSPIADRLIPRLMTRH